MRTIVPAALIAIAAATAAAEPLNFAAVTISFPDPDSLITFDATNPGATTTHVATLAGAYVRGLDMDTAATGWYISTAGTGAGLYRLTETISSFIAPLPSTSVDIGGLTLNRDNTHLYYIIGGGTTGPVELFRVDFDGTFTFLGEVTGTTGRFAGLAAHPVTGMLYALDVRNSALYTVDPATAHATRVGTGLGFGTSNLVGGLDFTTNGRLFMVSNFGEVREIDPDTGIAGPLLGSLGVSASAIAYLPGTGPGCYPDCNGDGTLNVSDFLCFIDEFAAAQLLPPQQQVKSYANCDGSTSEPILSINDFLCFIDEFAQGCP